MRIHFGGSSKGYRELKDTYLIIRRAILSLGHGIARDWLNLKVIKETKSLKEAFRQTEKAIGESEAVILEASYDSSSLGKQMIMAHNQNLPILLLIHKNYPKSPTLAQFIGKEDFIKMRTYSEENIKKIVADFLEWVEKSTKPARFNLELDKKLDNYLRAKARANKTSKSEEIRKLILEDMMKSSKIK